MMPRVSNEQAIALRPPIEERLEYSSPKSFKSRLGFRGNRKNADAIRTRGDFMLIARGGKGLQVALVQGDQMKLILHFRQHVSVFVVQACRSVYDDDQDVRVGCFALSALDPHGLDLIDRLPDASSVNQQDRHSVDANRLRQSVASGTWNLGYDSPAASQQPIEKTRLTDIWPSDERSLESVA